MWLEKGCISSAITVSLQLLAAVNVVTHLLACLQVLSVLPVASPAELACMLKSLVLLRMRPDEDFFDAFITGGLISSARALSLPRTRHHCLSHDATTSSLVLHAAASEACMARFSRAQLLDVLWSLARVHYLPDAAWLSAYKAALRAHTQGRGGAAAHGLSEGDEEVLAWACRQLGGLRL